MNMSSRRSLIGLVASIVVVSSTIVSAADNVTTRPSYPYFWGVQEGGLALSIHPLAKSIRAGDPMKVAIGLRNNGPTIHVFRTIARSDYQFVIVGPDGRKIPMLRESRKPEDTDFYTLTSSGSELKPGMIYEKIFDIDNNYDVRMPGKYSITAKSEVFLGESGRHYAGLKSNTIEVTVTR